MFINTCYQSMSMFRREEGGRRYLYQHLLPEYYLACSEGGRRGREDEGNEGKRMGRGTGRHNES